MDKYNRFFSQSIYRLIRLDWLCIMTALIITVAVHWREVNWWRFTIMFWIIDFIGTVPGMYIYHRYTKNSGGDVPRWCFHAYNFCHSFVTVSAVTLVWYLLAGLEWAMLAMPMHLAADRSIFGNIYKNLGLKFEPEPNEGFARFSQEFERSQTATTATGRFGHV